MMFQWVQRIGNWWRRERFITDMLRTLESGVGCSETIWPQGSSINEILTWCDDQVAGVRRPYGVVATKIAIAPSEASTAIWEALVSRAHPWEGDVRDAVATQLASLVRETDVKVGVVALGTAMSNVLNTRYR